MTAENHRTSTRVVRAAPRQWGLRSGSVAESIEITGRRPGRRNRAGGLLAKWSAVAVPLVFADALPRPVVDGHPS
jgi:hypothetical protein